jgi:hypothetical protein
MTHGVSQRLLDGIELRERQPADQVGELAARPREAGAEPEALQITAETVRAMAAGRASNSRRTGGRRQAACGAGGGGAVQRNSLACFSHHARNVPGARPVRLCTSSVT